MAACGRGKAYWRQCLRKKRRYGTAGSVSEKKLGVVAMPIILAAGRPRQEILSLRPV
jgi:hypothetical protein